ncbi:MAG: hypothetical protein QM493_11215 [Sulfurovum sp.]
MTNQQIEEIELKYLNKFYHFMKFTEDEMMIGFATKEDIKSDWIGKYDSKISDFAVGAERIIYSLFNGKGIGQPNSCPVGADMFFEVIDAFIHIDLKTVEADGNIGDYVKNIFVGTNQNSYASEIVKSNGESFSPKRMYHPALPTYYKSDTPNPKICLSYFVTVLYSKDTLDILNINISCMPNGQLQNHYKNRVLSAGKNLDKARFNFTEVSTFELLKKTPSRLKVIFFDENMKSEFKKKLSFFENIYNNLKT